MERFHDPIVSFDVAKLAQELGFYKEPKEHGDVFGAWYNDRGVEGGRIDTDEDGNEFMRHEKYAHLSYDEKKALYIKSYYAPTIASMTKWLRDVHKIYVIPFLVYRNPETWMYKVQAAPNINIEGSTVKKTTYESAMNDGSLVALQLLKEI